MNSVKNVSRFAVLGIDSDSSEDDEKPRTIKGQKVSSKNFGPYHVSNQNQSKKKKRKAKPTKVQAENNADNEWHDTDDKLVEIEENQLRQAVILSRQEFEEEEEKRKEHDKVVAETLERSKVDVDANNSKTSTKSDLPQTTIASVSDASISNGPGCLNELQSQLPDHITSYLREIDEEAKHIRRGRPNLAAGDGRNAVEKFYRDKCLEILLSKDEEVQKLRADYEKAKQKNKKYLQIFNDSEIREKAEIVVEIEKVKNINSELTEQVTLISAELEQTKSKNHELEIEIKKLTAAKSAAK